MKFNLKPPNQPRQQDQSPVAAPSGVKRELKKFKSTGSRSQSKGNAASAELREELASLLQDLAERQQDATWSIETLDDLWASAMAPGASLKAKLECRAFLLTVFRQQKLRVQLKYNTVLKYMLQRHEEEQANSSLNQVYMVDTVMEALMQEPYTAQFVVKVADDQRKRLAALFKLAAAVDEAKLPSILDSWCSSGVSKLTEQRLRPGQDLKSWFMEGGRLTNSTVKAPPPPKPQRVLGRPGAPFDQQPASAIIPLVQAAARSAVDVSCPPPIDAAQIQPVQIKPASFTPDLYKTVDSYYRYMMNTTIHPLSDTAPRGYEGWTLQHEQDRRIQILRLNAQP